MSTSKKRATRGPSFQGLEDLRARCSKAWKIRDALRASFGAEPPDFPAYFLAVVKARSVPADIPWAVSWADLEKTRKIPTAVKRIRGKLNVPRERFRTTADGRFVWAGMESA